MSDQLLTIGVLARRSGVGTSALRYWEERVLSARGLQVPAEIRERVLSCADTSQLETWGDRAATAATIHEVFGN